MCQGVGEPGIWSDIRGRHAPPHLCLPAVCHQLCLHQHLYRTMDNDFQEGHNESIRCTTCGVSHSPKTSISQYIYGVSWHVFLCNKFAFVLCRIGLWFADLAFVWEGEDHCPLLVIALPWWVCFAIIIILNKLDSVKPVQPNREISKYLIRPLWHIVLFRIPGQHYICDIMHIEPVCITLRQKCRIYW